MNYNPYFLASVSDLCLLIAHVQNKQCEQDPIATWLLKDCASDLAPWLMDMFNKSFIFLYIIDGLEEMISYADAQKA